MSKLINRIPGSSLLIALRTFVESHGKLRGSGLGGGLVFTIH